MFRKSLLLRLGQGGGRFSAGEVQTLMAVDADRVTNLVASCHELWALPAQILIALYLLYTQVCASWIFHTCLATTLL